jgi:Uma2 family endonuclease
MQYIGAWRSLVAHLYGVQGVAGSNPVAPMNEEWLCWSYDRAGPFFFGRRGGMSVQEKVREETTKWVGPRPLTFAQFLELYGAKAQVELIDGVVVERSMVPLDHEKLLGWLRTVLDLYVEARGLGIVLGSRTAVEIDQFRERLPDLLFVRQSRMEIVQQKAVYGAPDLLLEISSPNDRLSDSIALETDYRAIGAPEIVFIDQGKRRVRVLRRQMDGYSEEILTAGVLMLESMDRLLLELEWLFAEPRPDQHATVDALLWDAAASDRWMMRGVMSTYRRSPSFSVADPDGRGDQSRQLRRRPREHSRAGDRHQ